jgi:hypothetical protein
MKDIIPIENIDILLKYLPIFESDKFNSTNAKLLKEGNLPFMLCYSEKVNEFVKDFYKSNLVYNFNWSEWQNEALNYFEKPELLKNVDIEIIRKLLTLHIRKERFCEGHLIDIIDSKHIVTILKRLKQIREDMSSNKILIK